MKLVRFLFLLRDFFFLLFDFDYSQKRDEISRFLFSPFPVHFCVASFVVSQLSNERDEQESRFYVTLFCLGGTEKYSSGRNFELQKPVQTKKEKKKETRTRASVKIYFCESKHRKTTEKNQR